MDLMKLRLSAQRALLGNVSPQLRGVCVQGENNKIIVNFYYDKKISTNDRDSAEDAVAEIMGDFWHDDEGNEIECISNITQLDYPQKMPLVGLWVYYRREDKD